MPPSDNGKKFWDVTSRIIVYVVIAMAGAVASHEVRINRIEENRFTAVDGAKMEQRLHDEIDAVPSWLREKISEIGQNQKELLSRMRELEKR